MERATRHRFVVVGEVHDSPCHHAAQARILDLLAAAGTSPAVGMESVSVDRQEVLDRFHAGGVSVEGLGRALAWEETWGYHFSYSAPVFEAAARWGLPVVALNLPDEIVRQVGRQGLESLSPEARALLPRILPPPREQEATLREVWEAHGGTTGRGFDRFLLIQSLWDSQMAGAAIEASRRQDRQVVILAGGGHVRRGWGIPHRIRVLLPGAAVLEVMPWTGPGTDPSEADLFFDCPRG